MSVFLTMYPFLPRSALLKIFGADLFARERRHQRDFAEPDRPDHQIEDAFCRQVVRPKALPVVEADCTG